MKMPTLSEITLDKYSAAELSECADELFSQYKLIRNVLSSRNIPKSIVQQLKGTSLFPSSEFTAKLNSLLLEKLGVGIEYYPMIEVLNVMRECEKSHEV